ncbi:CDP-alcohol phosphatidyltransferase family protein [Spartinivicinus poritis]|uniref:CDP-alcohol phosphatidyltransferase family protein n=1 Tax=Spartinivicinus poritis TaxID=2994640 RepID=A0ABT5U8D3_9GAMM|nr:CDP-alcohol phosphatidyltransferase family protein [Spartinivicinus sp. A2-2]MDE1462450.1 CDP-alcohol phosphatidyltransferase family protein [Spartinivicinus sp. A2-2]
MMTSRPHYLMLSRYIDGANLVTGVNLLIGALALMLLQQGVFLPVIGLIFLAILLDHLDGWLARRFYSHSTHKRAFGKQFDTLADLFNFNGVSGLLLFFQQPNHPWLAGVVAASLILFGAIRLAHFTLDTGEEEGLQTPYVAFVIINLILLNQAGLLSDGLLLGLAALTSVLQIICVRIPVLDTAKGLTLMATLLGVNFWFTAPI